MFHAESTVINICLGSKQMATMHARSWRGIGELSDV